MREHTSEESQQRLINGKENPLSNKGCIQLIEYCINFSKKENCYKIILNCNDTLINFYKKYGFENKNNEMSLYFIKSKL